MAELLRKPTAENFLAQSRRFSDWMQIYTPVLRRIFNLLDREGFNGFAMNMFGEALFTISPREASYELAEVLKKQIAPGGKVIVSEIDQAGARVVA